MEHTPAILSLYFGEENIYEVDFEAASKHLLNLVSSFRTFCMPSSERFKLSDADFFCLLKCNRVSLRYRKFHFEYTVRMTQLTRYMKCMGKHARISCSVKDLVAQFSRQHLAFQESNN